MTTVGLFGKIIFRMLKLQCEGIDVYLLFFTAIFVLHLRDAVKKWNKEGVLRFLEKPEGLKVPEN